MAMRTSSLLAVTAACLARADYCSSPTSCVQAGFCTDAAHIETGPEQPKNQLERWELPFVNATHVVIRWSPSAALCSRTIDRYEVNLNSSSRVFNMVLSAFGTFPQDACDAGSLARAAAKLGDGRQAVSPCGTYERRCSHAVTETIVEVYRAQWIAFGWAPENLTVQASGYGVLRQPYGGGKRVPLWCISFRKYNPKAGGPLRAASGAQSLCRRTGRWIAGAARRIGASPLFGRTARWIAGVTANRTARAVSGHTVKRIGT